MKTKQTFEKLANLKHILVLQLIFFLSSVAFGQEPYLVVDEMPTFPGGDAALAKYISGKINYPEIALEKNVQGKVILRFCVKPDGSINQITVLKSIEASLDKEAIRVANLLPAFNPGKKDGTAVSVWYYLPINFVLARS